MQLPWQGRSTSGVVSVLVLSKGSTVEARGMEVVHPIFVRAVVLLPDIFCSSWKMSRSLKLTQKGKLQGLSDFFFILKFCGHLLTRFCHDVVTVGGESHQMVDGILTKLLGGLWLPFEP